MTFQFRDAGNQVHAGQSFFSNFYPLLLRLAGRILNRDPLAFGLARPSIPLLNRIQCEQADSISNNTPLMMLASCLNAVVWTCVSFGRSWSGLAFAWTGIAIALSGVIAAQTMDEGKGGFAEPARRQIKKITGYAIAYGCLWGLFPLLFLGSAGANERLIVVCLCSGMMFVGATAFSAVPAAMSAFLTPSVIGTLIALADAHIKAFEPLATLIAFYAVVLFVASAINSAARTRRCVALLEVEINVLKDELTKLPNRKFFREEMARALARLNQAGEGFAVMCFDLDGFKKVNDTMGHAAGDQVLIEAARRLNRCTRSVDVLARFGGDEFALIATDISTDAQAKAVAERIVRVFKEPFVIEGVRHKVTISVGVALAPSDGVDGFALLHNADSALYAAKNSGRSDYALFREQFALVAERATLETEFKRALAQGEVSLAFQPSVNLTTLQTTGFRAILRWLHPTRGLLSSAQIVPMLERGGLTEMAGAFLLEKAVAAAVHWPENLRLSLPVSHLQLREAGFARSVEKILMARNFDPRRLEVELTQTKLIVESPEAMRQLRILRGMGVSATLKDLDAGYGSLVNLVELPLTRLCIDKRLVRELGAGSLFSSVARISCELARALQLEITAEGVENEDQLDAIRRLGGHEARGPIFGEPGMENALANLMRFPGSAPRHDAAQAA